jgi:hypothetical protein
LAEARHTRTQQRTQLYHFLLANERQMPSTSDAIFEAIQREKVQHEEDAAEHIRTRSQNLALVSPPGDALAPSSISFNPHASQRRSLFQNFLTLATVAAVILAAVGLLNRFTSQHGTAPAPNQSSQPPVQPNFASKSDGWDSMVIGLTVLSATGMVKSLTFYSYNAGSGKTEQLLSTTQAFSAVSLEGVSQDGQKLLYNTTSTDQRKSYTTFSPTTGSHTLYQLDASRGGNAIWLDATHVLVQNTGGTVIELDAQSGTVVHAWPLETGALTFYRQPFLYFVGAENLNMGALYRVNLAEAHATPQQVTQVTLNTRFWLSIDGTTVFYANQGSSGEQGIYAVGSDGKDSRLLRKGPGMPIGYAANNALMLLEQDGNRLEVIQMGATPGAPEHVVLANAAPGATSLCGPSGAIAIIAVCDQNAALQPYGNGLLLHAYYSNGSQSLVYDDLLAGTSHAIRSLPSDASVQLPGWSKLAPSAVSSTADRTLAA